MSFGNRLYKIVSASFVHDSTMMSLMYSIQSYVGVSIYTVNVGVGYASSQYVIWKFEWTLSREWRVGCDNKLLHFFVHKVVPVSGVDRNWS